MKNPTVFQTLVFLILTFISFVNLFFAKQLIFFVLTDWQIFSFFIVTCFFGGCLFGGWSSTMPFGAQISRLCVFWFVIQLIILPLWLLILILKISLGFFISTDLNYLYQFLASIILLFASLISFYGTFIESLALTVTNHTIELTNLDEQANGLKLVHLSDLHLGAFFYLEDLIAVLEKTREQEPNVVVITGDLIDDLTLLKKALIILDEYSELFDYGIYFCWGNHEYFRNYAFISQALQRSKIKVLKNQSDLLGDFKHPFYLLGVDYSFESLPEHVEDAYRRMLAKTCKEVAHSSTKVLLSHHSAVIDQAFARQIDLTLAGHTHGTHVGFCGKPLFKNAFKYIRGLHKKGNSTAYVSRGVRGWFPFRFGCSPEIAVFTFKKFNL